MSWLTAMPYAGAYSTATLVTLALIGIVCGVFMIAGRMR